MKRIKGTTSTPLAGSQFKAKKRKVKQREEADASPSARPNPPEKTHLQNKTKRVEFNVEKWQDARRCRFKLAVGESKVFVGEAKLKVHEGCLRILGKEVRPNDGEIWISTRCPPECGIEVKAIEGFVKVPHPPQSCVLFEVIDLQQTEEKFELQEMYGDNSKPCLLSPHSWIKACSGICEQLKSGPKKHRMVISMYGDSHTGKSSLFRFVINSLLNVVGKVAAMDLDLGQTEFTPPGVMGITMIDKPLIGQPCMRQIEPSLTYFMGTTNPGQAPKRYMSYAACLTRWWERYSTDVPQDAMAVPLVVNTCGWVAGLGKFILLEIFQTLNPTHIFRFQGSAEDCWPSEFDVTVNTEVVDIRAISNKQTYYVEEPGSESIEYEKWEKQFSVPKKDPKAQRDLMWMRSALQCIGATQQLFNWLDASKFNKVGNALCAAKPWVISRNDLEFQFLFGNVSEKDLLLAINGAIVGLCCRTVHLQNTNENEENVENVPKVCVGLGLIRGVDHDNKKIFLLTNVSRNVLSKVNLVQVGHLRAPEVISITDQHVPPWIAFGQF